MLRSRADTPTTRSAITRSGCAATCCSARPTRSTRLNEIVKPFRILKGIEVNIRPDGTLDVSDEELATRDWVVASVHSRFDHDADRARLRGDGVARMSIASGTSRTGRSAVASPSPVEIERVVEKALETGTFLEINSQPDRLDLTDVHARAAREAGLKLAIDSDGHSVGALDYVELGVGQARRAWLTQGGRAEHAHVGPDRRS